MNGQIDRAYLNRWERIESPFRTSKNPGKEPTRDREMQGTPGKRELRALQVRSRGSLTSVETRPPLARQAAVPRTFLPPELKGREFPEACNAPRSDVTAVRAEPSSAASARACERAARRGERGERVLRRINFTWDREMGRKGQREWLTTNLVMRLRRN